MSSPLDDEALEAAGEKLEHRPDAQDELEEQRAAERRQGEIERERELVERAEELRNLSAAERVRPIEAGEPQRCQVDESPEGLLVAGEPVPEGDVRELAAGEAAVTPKILHPLRHPMAPAALLLTEEELATMRANYALATSSGDAERARILARNIQFVDTVRFLHAERMREVRRGLPAVDRVEQADLLERISAEAPKPAIGRTHLEAWVREHVPVEPSEVHFTPKCHPERGAGATYSLERGELVLYCATCRRSLLTLAVAP